MDDSPRLIIVGGPNGAGKTTIALEYAKERQLPYLGADAIAVAFSPDNPSAARIPAARQFIEEFGQYVSARTSFVCESTLSGVTMRNFIASARGAGYVVSTVFVFVESAEICVARVVERARKGGHDVPAPDIRRRFGRSLRNFWGIYRRLSDHWVLTYNGATTLQDVAAGARDQTVIRDS